MSIFSHRLVGHSLSPRHGPQPCPLLDSRPDWPDYSHFCSSHDFARFSPNFLRLFCLSSDNHNYFSALILYFLSLLAFMPICTRYKTQHWVPGPPCVVPKVGLLVLSVIGFPFFSKLWFLSAHQALNGLLYLLAHSYHQPQWADLFLHVALAPWTSQLSVLPLSSRILDLCSHLPGKSCFYHSCGFWWGGLSSLEIDDPFLYSCFLDPLWKDLSSSTASGQGTKRSLLNMQTLQPAFQLLLLQKVLFNT